MIGRSIRYLFKQPALLWLAVLGGTLSCMRPNTEDTMIKVSSDFEAGGIILKENMGDSLLICDTKHWLKRDSIGNQFYWFYFKMANVRNKEIKVRLENLKGTYRGKPHKIYQGIPFPVYSYDQKTWDRIENVAYNDNEKSFEFTNTYSGDSVWVAYAHPYTYTQGVNLIKKAATHPYVQVDTVATTKEGREIYLLQIEDPASPEGIKKTVYFQALQHSGEMAGGYMLEGLVDYLLDTTQSKQLLENYRLVVVPVVNPDGLVHGVSRYNFNMNDLNSQWFENVEEIEEPEVKGLISWINNWYDQGNTIDHAFDVHCWGQRDHNLYITNNDTLYHKRINKLTPFKVIPSNNVNNANWYFQYVRNIPVSTVELSQKTGQGTELYTISDFREIGANFAKALLTFSQQENTSEL